MNVDHTRSKTLGWLGALAAASLLASGQAQAGAYGLAVNELNSFRITTSAGALSLAGANRNASDSAFFEGGVAVNPRAVNTGPAANADVLQVCSGGGCGGLPQNNYAPSPSSTLEFARGDAHAFGNMLTAAGSTVRAVAEAQRDTVGAATATAGDTLTGSVNLTLSSAGFITFNFMGRRDLRTSVTTMGDKSSVSIMDIFNISCNTSSPVGCLSNANADGVIFQFAPDGDANNGSDVNGNHTVGSLDPFSLNMTAGTNDPATGRAFTNGFAMFSLTSNFALPAGSYTLNFSKSTRTDIVVIEPLQVPEPGTLFLLGTGLAALAFTRRRQPK
ncbi:PEP-CTERM motif protein [Janthinobacterium sp. KBS0711]|uniref:EDSAP-1 family PEP-CTERM protein n=1 Tax=Janthinobacterium TaxID=29580 RepID=UPI000631E2F0|nr:MULTISPECIES: EDSAP-1 family PEP-CTERM protein [Janthinobacterium]KKO66095.1 PEP-CTERM motif protein [Janthinobacterium sp. KBS0711]NHQ88963.1 PEP-CTERM sorting domain-containing protein [Janthinobacterium lividum]TSD69982.1 PEP-CTERM sorting domain-containing protein [Janthinobacterium sp. KBS0711]